MAVNNTIKSYSKMEFPLSIQRQGAFALDPTEVWSSLEAAREYAQNDPTAYVGQPISVVTDGVSKMYQIKNAAGDLEPLGGMNDSNVASDGEVAEMLNEVFTSVTEGQTDTNN